MLNNTSLQKKIDAKFKYFNIVLPLNSRTDDYGPPKFPRKEKMFTSRFWNSFAIF